MSLSVAMEASASREEFTLIICKGPLPNLARISRKVNWIIILNTLYYVAYLNWSKKCMIHTKDCESWLLQDTKKKKEHRGNTFN